MIYRLSGNSSPSNIWKIINAGNARKDFIKSYSIKNIDDKSYNAYEKKRRYDNRRIPRIL